MAGCVKPESLRAANNGLVSRKTTTAEETPPAEAAYDAYAADYRDWWAPVIAPAAVRLLDRLEGQLTADASGTIVDIGTGTGTLALAALRRWPQVRVIGVDPARRLLEMAEADARAAGIAERLEVRVGDAANLPLGDASADVAVSSFVLQLVPNRLAAVREAFRVLRPGGSFACLTWRADEDPFEPEDIFDDVLEDLKIEPPKRSPGKGRSYSSPASASAELRRAGFRSVRARQEWLEHRFTPASYVDVAEHWTEDDTFAPLDEPMRQQLRAEVLRRLERLDPDRLVWRRPLVSVLGIRPAASMKPMKRDRPDPDRLPSKPSAGQLIGGLLANLDHALTGRPKTPAQIEEQYREPWASADGLTVGGLDDPIERPEQPDRSGAKL